MVHAAAAIGWWERVRSAVVLTLFRPTSEVQISYWSVERVIKLNTKGKLLKIFVALCIEAGRLKNKSIISLNELFKKFLKLYQVYQFYNGVYHL